MLSTVPHGVPLTVHTGAEELLVEVCVGKRQQSVSVTMKACKSANCHLVRLISRACPVGDHLRVRSALVTNNNLELGGMALEASTNPHVIDVIHNLVADGMAFQEFVQSLYAVAVYADQIEYRIVGSDNF